MITYNEAKQLLNQGIFPCLINNGDINYITGYNDKGLTVITFNNKELVALFEDSELCFRSTGGLVT